MYTRGARQRKAGQRSRADNGIADHIIMKERIDLLHLIRLRHSFSAYDLIAVWDMCHLFPAFPVNAARCMIRRSHIFVKTEPTSKFHAQRSVFFDHHALHEPLYELFGRFP